MEELEPAGYYGAQPSNVKGAPYGVVWEGPWIEPFDSFGQVSRRMVMALVGAGMPVCVLTNNIELFDNPSEVVCRELGCSVNAEATKLTRAREQEGTGKPSTTVVYNQDGPVGQTLDRILVTVHHTVPRFDVLNSILYPASSRFVPRADIMSTHRYRILMTAFETDRVPDAAAIPLLRRFGQVWVPCRRNADVLVDAGVNAHVVPHPMPTERAADLASYKSSVRKGLGKDSLYTFYNIGKWEPRKNQLGLIRAFLMAFKADIALGSTRLLLKTSPFGNFKDYPRDASEAISVALKHPAAIQNGWDEEKARKCVLYNSSFMSEREIMMLHARGDCYVSASHGEAWDMPAFDALAAGSKLIHVGFGGSEDYALNPIFHDDDSTEVAHPGYRWGQARWARVDEEALATAMLNADLASSSFWPGAVSECSPEAVGNLARKLILECAGRTEEEVHGWRLRAGQHQRHRLRDERAVPERRDLRLPAPLGCREARGAAQGGGQACNRLPDSWASCEGSRRGLRHEASVNPALPDPVPEDQARLQPRCRSHGHQRQGDRAHPGLDRPGPVGGQDGGAQPLPGGSRRASPGAPHLPRRRPRRVGGKHRALVGRGGWSSLDPRDPEEGRNARPHHAQPRQPPRPDGPAPRRRGALLLVRPHL